MGDTTVGFKADKFVVRINRPGKPPAGGEPSSKSTPTAKPVSHAASSAVATGTSASARALRVRVVAEARSRSTPAPGPPVEPLPRLPIEAFYLYPRTAAAAPAGAPGGVTVIASSGGAPPPAAGDTHFLVWILLALLGTAGVLGGLYALVLALLPTEERVSWFVSDVLPSVGVVLGVLAVLGSVAAAAGYYLYFYFPYLPVRINGGALDLPTITLPTLTFLAPPEHGTLATTGVALPAFPLWEPGPPPPPAPAPAPQPKVQLVYKIN